MATNKSLIVLALMAAVFMASSKRTALALQELDQSGYSYLSQARQFFDTGMEANHKAQAYSSLMPNEDPRAARMLRDSINKATGSFIIMINPFLFALLLCRSTCRV